MCVWVWVQVIKLERDPTRGRRALKRQRERSRIDVTKKQRGTTGNREEMRRKGQEAQPEPSMCENAMRERWLTG